VWYFCDTVNFISWCLAFWHTHPFAVICQYYIFAYVDAPAYQILKNLNIISTGVLYRIILKKKLVSSEQLQIIVRLCFAVGRER
jgi:hypothetical protein